MSKLSRRQVQVAATPPAEVRPFGGLARIQAHAAGADIGAHEILVCVPGPADTQIVRAFGTYTADLESLAAWLKEYAVKTIAMESTGVYWIPTFELLEQRGLHCCLINAAAIKRMPGRKSDVADCQWIQTLHSYGLLSDSFRPDADLIALRTLLRHRAQLIEHRAPHILHMQKALQQMNLQLHHVLSDITGTTGLAILRAIVAGERDPLALARLRHPSCKSTEETIVKALTGTWRQELLFVLRQSLELYDYFTAQIETCNAQIEHQYAAIQPRWAAPDDLPSLPPVKPGSKSKNKPAESTRQELFRICGIDLVAVDGISVNLAQIILSEIGTDMSRFPTVKQFCSWLGVAPHNDISGGVVLRSRTLKTDNRAGQAFRQAAASVIRSDSALGAFYRRKRAQIGPMQALVATAHKIARLVYVMLKNKSPFQHTDAAAYETRQREQELAHLKRKAAKLGFDLTSRPTAA